jgi:hypothetical protein
MPEALRQAADALPVEIPAWAWEQFALHLLPLIARDALERAHARREPDRHLRARVLAAARQFVVSYVADTPSWGLSGLRPRDLGAMLPARLPDLRVAKRPFSLLRLRHDFQAAHKLAGTAPREPQAARVAVLRSRFPDVPVARLERSATAQDVACEIVAARAGLSPETVRRWAYAKLNVRDLLAREGQAGLDYETAKVLRNLLRDL